MKNQIINHLLKVWLALIVLSFQMTAITAQTTREVTGIVYDEQGEGLPGVTVLVDKSSRGVVTDIDGSFSIKVGNTDVLIFSYLGYQTQKITVGIQKKITVNLQPKTDELDEVTVVGFAKQKKESVIASVTTIKPSELKVPSSNLTQGLSGRLAGVIGYQSSGEPGKDNVNFFIRGVTTFGYSASPLILIDNIESSADELARLPVDDVASFSIMKDATATAIYGARGANGVVLVTTKEGKEGPAEVNIRLENSISTPARNIEMADPITYMKMYNEAMITRNPLAPRPFSDEKIANTGKGLNPYVYPEIDWYDELFKKTVMNQRVNVSLKGGGTMARYYVSANFSQDNGALKVDPKNNYNTNIDIKNIQLRTNVNLNLTKTTQFDIRVNANFQDYNGPIDGGDMMYRKVRVSSPVMFPKSFAPDDSNVLTQHVLFGNTDEGNYLNPYADMIRGYRDSHETTLTAQMELSQKLDFLTEGLSFRILANTTRYSGFSLVREISPFYYNIGYYDKDNDRYTLNLLNPETGREDLNYSSSAPSVNSTYYFEAALNYARRFGKHDVGGLLVGTMREYISGNAPNIQESLPSRNIGLSGRATYAYDSRYLFEFNFGYNGSERFAKKERFGFFPSAGIGYLISNEPFWHENKYVNKLKLKATYGLVGNDKIGNLQDRFYYISEVNLNAGDSSIRFGEDWQQAMQTIATTRYGNPNITWEVARKLDIGVETTLFNFLEVQADYFQEKREKIYQDRPTIPAELGYAAKLSANVGRASSRGFEVQMDANHSFNKNWWMSLRGNFTFARSNYDYAEEARLNYWWQTVTGYPIGQQRGLIADRLFIDEADIANSPRQMFSDYMPGDIKYRDINGDDIIDDNDVVPIGYPTVPEINYGFGVSVGYKNFDISCFFQGSGRSSFYVDAMRNTPFVNADSFDNDTFKGRIAPNGLMQCWVNNYWSESNRNSYAAMPRLTTETVENNTRASTWWIRDGSYIRLKSVEMGYTFSDKILKKLHMTNLRIYASGLNLLTFSKFKEWDIEMGGNGFNYPIQAVYNIGLNIGF
ncbi:SusC/RagA family TonB-linked outer membrane protein [Bacteroides faecalis]|uniref:SusC/RagA family TonB-linked outer membrane protein n=1 Tax=Bacteroides faecalis TaxID=2447885 RepID=A0A401LPB2_9BACE|nr:TonB-dependent receptor [Bacteroides faecalis]GCB33376.1 SusC/RagA family TonB-linked outer membrane protein [Bacteroides faecalis]